MVTEYVSKSWKIYKKNAGSFIASELIVGIIPLILIVLGVGIFLASILPMINLEMIVNMEEDLLMQYFTDLFKTPGFINSLLQGILGFGTFLLIAILISTYLKIGQYGMAYESLKRRTKIKTMFKVSGKIGLRWIATVLILFVIGFIALIPIVIIGVLTLGLGFVIILLVLPILSLIAPAMVVSDISPFESIKKAFRVAKKNYLNLFALWLIYYIGMILISFLGGTLSFVPGIGGLINLSTTLFVVFVVQPMVKISFVNFYKRNKRGS